MLNSLIPNSTQGKVEGACQGIVATVAQPKIWAGAATAAGFVAATTTAVAFAIPAAAMACFTAAIVLAVPALIFATIAAIAWAVQHRNNAGDNGQVPPKTSVEQNGPIADCGGQSRIHEKQPNDGGGAAFSKQPTGAENGAHITFDQHQSEHVGGGTPFIPNPQPETETEPHQQPDPDLTRNDDLPWAGPMREAEQKFYDGLDPKEQTLYRTLSEEGRTIYRDLKNSKDGAYYLGSFFGQAKLKDSEKLKIVEALPKKFQGLSTSDLRKIGFDDTRPIDFAQYSQLKYLTIDDINYTNFINLGSLKELTCLHLYFDVVDNPNISKMKEQLLCLKNVGIVTDTQVLQQLDFTQEEIMRLHNQGNKLVPESSSTGEFLNQLFGKPEGKCSDRRRIVTDGGHYYKFFFERPSAPLSRKEFEPFGPKELMDANKQFYDGLSLEGKKLYIELMASDDGEVALGDFLAEQDWEKLPAGEMLRIVEALPEKFGAISTDDLTKIGFDDSHPIDWSQFTHLTQVTITDPAPAKNLEQAPDLQYLYIAAADSDLQAIKGLLLRVKDCRAIKFKSSIKPFAFTTDEVKSILENGNNIRRSSKIEPKEFMDGLFGDPNNAEDTADIRIRYGKGNKKYRCSLIRDFVVDMKEVESEDH